MGFLRAQSPLRARSVIKANLDKTGQLLLFISVFSAFETNPWPLILINMGRPFLAFAISGIVLGAWRRREL